MKIIKTKNYDEMSEEAVKIFLEILTKKPNAVFGLATGSTPIGIYKRLVDAYKFGKADFSEVSTVNLDEYVGLPNTHEQSYRYFMNDNLFDYINIDKINTNVPNGMATDLDAECRRYDGVVKKQGNIDIQLLGLGQNGHIGFNEPSDKFSENTNIVTLTESTREANKRFFNSIDEVPKKAITMGLAQIMDASKIILVASGKTKADAVASMVNGEVSPKCPASILQKHKDAIIIVDEDAGAKI